MLFSCMGWMVMSNTGIDNLLENITTEVDTLWVLKDRDDLKTDCIEYVFKNWESGFKDEVYLVIEFLSMKCAYSISKADLKAMAIEDKERKASTYEEATQGL